jgi:hypothetical protein
MVVGAYMVGVLSLPTDALSQAEQQVSGFQRPLPTRDGVFARATTRLEGFGGMFVNEEENVRYVYWQLHVPWRLAELDLTLSRTFGIAGLDSFNLQVLLAEFSFAELNEWHERLSPVVLAIAGTVLTDVDEVRNRIQVGVESVEIQPLVAHAVVSLGIPLGAVLIEQVDPIFPQASLQDRHRPLVGGLQIQRQPGRQNCTLGFNAIRPPGGVAGFVTNSHCTATRSVVEGTIFHQPTIAMLNRIGVETVDPPFFMDGPCPARRRCRYSDSAFARRDQGVAVLLGRIARPALNAVAWDGVSLFRIIGEVRMMVEGEIVTKVGRTTGRTQGAITAVGVNINSGRITFLDQTMAAYASAPGDSGAPVFKIVDLPERHDVKLYGIHWGTGASFSPIGVNNVQRGSELGPLTKCAPPFPC